MKKSIILKAVVIIILLFAYCLIRFCIASINWNGIFDTLNTNEAVAIFHGSFLNII